MEVEWPEKHTFLLHLTIVWRTSYSLATREKDRSDCLLVKCKDGHSDLFWTTLQHSSSGAFIHTETFPRERHSQLWLGKNVAIRNWLGNIWLRIKGRHLKSCWLMSEMINNYPLLSFSSVTGPLAKDCTWFVSANPPRRWSRDRIQFFFYRWSN